MVDTHGVVGVALPPEGGRGLDRERRHVGREHLLAVVVGLRGEEVPRRHRHHPHRQAVEQCSSAATHTETSEPVASSTRSRPSPVLVDEGVGPAGNAGGCALGRARQHRELLPGEHQRGRARRRRRGSAHAWLVSLASAGRMTRSPGIARMAASCSTGWWVGPSSPSPTESWVQTNRRLVARQRGQAHRAAHVVAEHEEGAARGHEEAHRHAVHDRAHAVLADAVVELAAAEAVDVDHRRVLELQAGVLGEVGAAAHQPGHDVEDGVDDRAARLAGGEPSSPASHTGSFDSQPTSPRCS